MILTNEQASEAVMNGARVQLRRYPPYLLCPLCRGDGSSMRPYAIQCSAAEHPAGWEIVADAPPRKRAGCDTGIDTNAQEDNDG